MPLKVSVSFFLVFLWSSAELSRIKLMTKPVDQDSLRVARLRLKDHAAVHLPGDAPDVYNRLTPGIKTVEFFHAAAFRHLLRALSKHAMSAELAVLLCRVKTMQLVAAMLLLVFIQPHVMKTAPNSTIAAIQHAETAMNFCFAAVFMVPSETREQLMGVLVPKDLLIAKTAKSFYPKPFRLLLRLLPVHPTTSDGKRTSLFCKNAKITRPRGHSHVKASSACALQLTAAMLLQQPLHHKTVGDLHPQPLHVVLCTPHHHRTPSVSVKSTASCQSPQLKATRACSYAKAPICTSSAPLRILDPRLLLQISVMFAIMISNLYKLFIAASSSVLIIVRTNMLRICGHYMLKSCNICVFSST